MKSWQNRTLPDDLKQKDGHLWRIYGCSPYQCSSLDQHQCKGQLLHYVLRKKYHQAAAAEAKNAQIYPAIESNYEQMDNFVQYFSRADPTAFGYAVKTEEGRFFCSVPDCDALNHLNQRSKLVHQPQYVWSHGIASDEEFFWANNTLDGTDGLISDGPECFHDLSLHAIMVQAAALRFGPRYLPLRNEHRRLFAAVWDRILTSGHVEAFQLAISMYIDQYHAMLPAKLGEDIKDDLLIHLQSVFKDKGSQRSRAYWMQRTGALPNGADQDKLIAAWHRCVDPSQSQSNDFGMTFRSAFV